MLPFPTLIVLNTDECAEAEHALWDLDAFLFTFGVLTSCAIAGSKLWGR